MKPITLTLYNGATDSDSLVREGIVAISELMVKSGFASPADSFKLEDMLDDAYKRWKRLNQRANTMRKQSNA